MKATMSSLSEIRLSGCIPLFIVSETRVSRTAINELPSRWMVGFGRHISCWINKRSGAFSARPTDHNGNGSKRCVVYSKESQMIFSKDYVGYLARQTIKHLVAEKMIHTDKAALVSERVAAAMVDELSLEDRINDEVRVILEAFQEDMRKTGASYPEMFKKVKNELARKYKAVL